MVLCEAEERVDVQLLVGFCDRIKKIFKRMVKILQDLMKIILQIATCIEFLDWFP